MAKNKDKKNVEQPIEQEFDKEVAAPENVVEISEQEQLQNKVSELEARVAELEDLKLRQMAEFDNFRRGTGAWL